MNQKISNAFNIFILFILCILSINAFFYFSFSIKKKNLLSELANSQVKINPFNYFEYIEAKYYLLKISSNIYPLVNSPSLKKENIINTARLGEALGFITENTNNQAKLIKLFPNGLFEIGNLINNLKSKKIIAPYGLHNNNYLTHNNTQIIFSDDSDLASLTFLVLQKTSNQDLYVPTIFANNLAKSFANYWIAMKKSGNYGVDGLYYGKRGYSKSMLLAMSALINKDRKKNNWYLADNKYPDTLDNGPFLRAWVIGLDPRITMDEAYKLGKIQSRITSNNKDISYASGALAATFKSLFIIKYQSREQIINTLLTLIKTHAGINSIAVKSINLGIQLNNNKTDPILLFNTMSGFQYNDFLTIFTYTLLHFNNFNDALFYIVHTPGDNDSLAFVLGAFFSAFNKIMINEDNLKYMEYQNWGLIH